MSGPGEPVSVGGGSNSGAVFSFPGGSVLVPVLIPFPGISGLGGTVEPGGPGAGISGSGDGTASGDTGAGTRPGFDEVVFGGEISGLGGSGGGTAGARAEPDDEGLGA